MFGMHAACLGDATQLSSRHIDCVDSLFQTRCEKAGLVVPQRCTRVRGRNGAPKEHHLTLRPLRRRVPGLGVILTNAIILLLVVVVSPR